MEDHFKNIFSTINVVFLSSNFFKVQYFFQLLCLFVSLFLSLSIASLLWRLILVFFPFIHYLTVLQDTLTKFSFFSVFLSIRLLYILFVTTFPPCYYFFIKFFFMLSRPLLCHVYKMFPFLFCAASYGIISILLHGDKVIQSLDHG